ncbi:hypothetical protein [Streptomyces griseus]|uniref:hypothetical protein n=1 Tax=Streptomyces griseus TaxID=1911 RepID=UPI0005608D9D|nr:hypothetical protein [Streptomyces griseus]
MSKSGIRLEAAGRGERGHALCLSKTDGMNLANFAADGLLTDISKVAAEYKGAYTVAAWKAVSPGGTTSGIPMGSAPLFTAYRADLFQKCGIEAPRERNPSQGGGAGDCPQ